MAKLVTRLCKMGLRDPQCALRAWSLSVNGCGWVITGMRRKKRKTSTTRQCDASPINFVKDKWFGKRTRGKIDRWDFSHYWHVLGKNTPYMMLLANSHPTNEIITRDPESCASASLFTATRAQHGTDRDIKICLATAARYFKGFHERSLFPFPLRY